MNILVKSTKIKRFVKNEYFLMKNDKKKTF